MAVADGGDAYTWNGNDSLTRSGHRPISSNHGRGVTVSGDGNTAMAVGGDKAYIRKKVAEQWGPWAQAAQRTSQWRD